MGPVDKALGAMNEMNEGLSKRLDRIIELLTILTEEDTDD